MMFNKIKEIRTSNRLSQKEMAKKLGVALSTYQYYERGERIPPSDFVVKLISTFGADPYDLLGVEKPSAVCDPSSLYGDEEIAEIIKWLREYPKDKKLILDLLRGKKAARELAGDVGC